MNELADEHEQLERTGCLRNRFQELLFSELQSIGFVELACKSKSVFVKLFWLALGTVGGVWLAYFMQDVIKDENPLVMMKKDLKVEDVKYPAITICSDVSTRYAIAERLGNLYDSKQELLKEFAMLRENLLDLITSGSFKSDQPDNWGIYMQDCLKGTYRLTKECEVRLKRSFNLNVHISFLHF